MPSQSAPSTMSAAPNPRNAFNLLTNSHPAGSYIPTNSQPAGSFFPVFTAITLIPASKTPMSQPAGSLLNQNANGATHGTPAAELPDAIALPRRPSNLANPWTPLPASRILWSSQQKPATDPIPWTLNPGP